MAHSGGPRRILGIDPGLNRTGYGIIEISGARLRWVESGVIRVPAGELPVRLETILRELAVVIARTAPAEASVEKVFVNVNPKSTLLLGQARGAAICAAVTAGVFVHEYSALEVKQAITGYGRADKLQMQKMVQRLLGLDHAPPSDAADALACAICHAHASGRSRAVAAQLAAAGALKGATAGSVAGTGAGAGAAPRRGGRAVKTRNAWRAFAEGK